MITAFRNKQLLRMRWEINNPKPNIKGLANEQARKELEEHNKSFKEWLEHEQPEEILYLDEITDKKLYGTPKYRTYKHATSKKWVSEPVSGVLLCQYMDNLQKPVEKRKTTKIPRGESIITLIKEHYTAKEILNVYGWEYEDKGRNLIIKCPNAAHEDKNPSTTIYADGGWKCFACGARGDLFSLAAHLEVKAE